MTLIIWSKSFSISLQIVLNFSVSSETKKISLSTWSNINAVLTLLAKAVGNSKGESGVFNVGSKNELKNQLNLHFLRQQI